MYTLYTLDVTHCIHEVHTDKITHRDHTPKTPATQGGRISSCILARTTSQLQETRANFNEHCNEHLQLQRLPLAFATAIATLTCCVQLRVQSMVVARSVACSFRSKYPRNDGHWRNAVHIVKCNYNCNCNCNCNVHCNWLVFLAIGLFFLQTRGADCHWNNAVHP